MSLNLNQVSLSFVPMDLKKQMVMRSYAQMGLSTNGEFYDKTLAQHSIKSTLYHIYTQTGQEIGRLGYYNEENYLHIDFFEIAPRLRGQGLGRKVIDTLKAFRIALFENATIKLFAKNQESHLFWIKMGFKKTGVKVADDKNEEFIWRVDIQNEQ